jgi:hypothetical protein
MLDSAPATSPIADASSGVEDAGAVDRAEGESARATLGRSDPPLRKNMVPPSAAAIASTTAAAPGAVRRRRPPLAPF